MSKNTLRLVLLVVTLIMPISIFCQDQVHNRRYFKKFFRSSANDRLLVLGENHASDVGAAIYPDLVKYLNRKTGLRTLLIEFGPSEAFFYNRYLETGDEKHLNYTLYAGGDKMWREAWRTLYAFNQKLKKPLIVTGIDFDRTRTFAYALYSIFMGYEQYPDFLQQLMAEIRTDEFYNTYSIGYPSPKEIDWVKKVKTLLKNNYWELQSFLRPHDLRIVTEVLQNEGTGYNEGREEILTETTQRVIAESDEQLFFLLIGRNHTYNNPLPLYGDRQSLVARLKKDSNIHVRTGPILFQDTDLWGGKNRSETIRLFEIEQKTPWKGHQETLLNIKPKQPLRVIPLTGDLEPLARYADFILLARGRRL